MTGELAGKVAIVTGAGSGIGRAIAELFAAEGARVAVAARNVATGQETVDRIRAQGGDAFLAIADVAIRSEVQRLVVETVERYGGIDVLVNNAAITLVKTLTETEEEEWDHVLANDLKSVFLCCKYVIPEMQRRGGGSIVNISSVYAIATTRRRAAYTAAKGGVLALTKSIALDYALDNIRCNCILPGTTDTPLLRGNRAGEPLTAAALEQWAKLQPIGRFADPKEIAQVALFLASDRSSFVTGAQIVADGGVTARFN